MDVIDESAEDRPAISKVVQAAFGRLDEARLIDELRRDGDLVFSLVALDGDILCGHAAFSRLKGVHGALALAPVAVRPDRQREGIGGALIPHGITRARELGETIIFVLGDPSYYQRFGFTAEAAVFFDCAYAGPHLMALRLTDAGPLAGTIVYPKAFAGFD